MRKKKKEFKKKVMENGEEKNDEHSDKIQETIEAAAGKVAHGKEANYSKKHQTM